MKNDVTKTAALSALILLVTVESGAAFLYFGVNNSEILPFIVGFAIVGVLSSIWVFTFVRAPESTRRKWYPLIYSIAVVAGIIGCCLQLTTLITGALQGKIELITVLQVLLSIYLTQHFWSKRQAALQDNSGISN